MSKWLSAKTFDRHSTKRLSMKQNKVAFLPIEEIDFLNDSAVPGFATATCMINAKHMAVSSFGAQAIAGVKPLESTAVTEQPLLSRISVTSIMPLGALMCKGLSLGGNTRGKQLKTKLTNSNCNQVPYFTKYSVQFFTLKMMLKYYLHTIHGR